MHASGLLSRSIVGAVYDRAFSKSQRNTPTNLLLEVCLGCCVLVDHNGASRRRTHATIGPAYKSRAGSRCRRQRDGAAATDRECVSSRVVRDVCSDRVQVIQTFAEFSAIGGIQAINTD